MRHRLIIPCAAAALVLFLSAGAASAMSGPPDWPDEDELPSANVPSAPSAPEAAPGRLPGAVPYAVAGLAAAAAAAVGVRRRRASVTGGTADGDKEKTGHRKGDPES